MVDRSIGIHPEADPAAILEHPAIRREADTTLAPCKARRRSGSQGLERGLFDRVSQLACIAIDPRPLIGRQRTGKDKFKPAAQGRTQCVWVEQTTNRSRGSFTFRLSRPATSSITFAPTRNCRRLPAQPVHRPPRRRFQSPEPAP